MRETPRARSSWICLAEREHNVIHWSKYDRSGHVAAMEAPDLPVDDVRAFFRKVRQARGYCA
ncbi:hypothetical protein [Nonomuraea sp. NPDC049129]|uniref:hypothetical protein n=1 Tax=Nonomuraea sp. NPDC049129 TaxID=3155272 RepID=UPI0033CD6161